MSPSVAFGGESPGSAMRYFRADIPAQSLAPFGWDAYSYDCLLAPESAVEIAADPRLRGTDMHAPELVAPADVITLRMRDDLNITDLDAPPNMPEQIHRAREAGQVVIYDIDDDYWKIPEWSPAYEAKSSWDQRRRAHDVELMAKMMEACNAVTVSTEPVRRSVLANTACRHVYVCRNGIDPDHFTQGKRHTGLRVGWMGSVTFHGEHLRSMIDTLDTLAKVKAETGQSVEFWHFGAARDLGTSVFQSRIPVPVVSITWRNFDDLIPLLGEVDVAIIPRWKGNAFAEGHSTSSGLEWAAAGVPYIATRTAEYAALAELGCGWVVESHDEWRAAFWKLLTGPRTMRRSIARRARETAIREHGLHATGARWAQVLDEVRR